MTDVAQGRVPALAFYWGDDVYGLERAAEEFGRRVAGSTGGEDLERWRVAGAATSADEIGLRVATAPLFGGGTLVVVADPAPLLRSKADQVALVAVVGSVAPGNALVFLESGDGSGRRPGSLGVLGAAVVAAGGETRQYAAPKEAQFARWIEDRARERSVPLGRGAAQALAERVGGFVREGDVDRRRQGQMAVAELAKLALYRPGGTIEADDVRELVPEAVPTSSWAFLDAVGARRAREATALLERLLETQPEPVIVAQLHRRIRELLEVADRIGSGESPGSLVKSMALNPYRAGILVTQARAWTPAELEAALEGLLELDVAVKGADGTAPTDAQRRLAFVAWVAARVAARG